jgi:glycosyltransferase involved in cell wall biosynthesis
VKHPKVFIISPFYNRESVVKQTVDSLLSQDYLNYEIIIIDDGSTDNTQKLLSSYSDEKLNVIVQENKGFTSSLINIIDKLDCDYVAIHGSGDVSHSNRLSAQVAFLENNPDVGFCGTASVNVEPATEEVVDYQKYNNLYLTKEDFYRSPPFTHGTVMFRLKDYKVSGGYDSRFEYSQDWDLWLRMVVIKRGAMLSDILYTRHVLKDGASFNPKKAMKQLFFKYLALDIHEGKVDRNSFFNDVKCIAQFDDDIKYRVMRDLEMRYFKLILLGADAESKELKRYLIEEYGKHSLFFMILNTIIRFLVYFGFAPSRMSEKVRYIFDFYKKF